MKAILMKEFGGADVLQLADVDLPPVKPGEVKVRLASIGVNYIDVYKREGTYPVPLDLPGVPGQEGAGVVEEIGDAVTTVKVGDRVAYCNVLGSYAQYAVVPADQLIPLPDSLSFVEGAGFPLQGMTAHYLVNDYVTLQPGRTVLVHAAAGGVGLLVVQWAKHLGAKVIATVSTPEKARIVAEAGADAVILYTHQDFVAEAKRIMGGGGADLVLDGVGKTTLAGSIEVAADGGTVVTYGFPSGVGDSISPMTLIARSLRLAGGNLIPATATRDALLTRAADVVNGLQAGWLRLRIEEVLPLQKADEAHRRLEHRLTSGKIVLST